MKHHMSGKGRASLRQAPSPKQQRNRTAREAHLDRLYMSLTRFDVPVVADENDAWLSLCVKANAGPVSLEDIEVNANICSGLFEAIRYYGEQVEMKRIMMAAVHYRFNDEELDEGDFEAWSNDCIDVPASALAGVRYDSDDFISLHVARKAMDTDALLRKMLYAYAQSQVHRDTEAVVVLRLPASRFLYAKIAPQ